MYVRTLIYSHVAAIALTGLVAYMDGKGIRETVAVAVLKIACEIAAISIMLFPLLLLVVVLAPGISTKDKLLTVAAEVPATIVHSIASFPLVQ